MKRLVCKFYALLIRKYIRVDKILKYIILWSIIVPPYLYVLCDLEGVSIADSFHTLMISILIIITLIILTLFKPCVKVGELPTLDKNTLYSMVDTLQDNVEVTGNFSSFSINEKMEPSRFKYLDDMAQRLIEEHIKEIPEFSKIKPRYYTGEMVQIHTREDWLKIGQSYTVASAGVHLTALNVSCVLTYNTSEKDILKTLIHERTHSMTAHEGLTTYVSYYLIWKYGSPENRLDIISLINWHIQNYTSNKRTEYDDCLYYICRDIDLFK